MRTNKAWGDFLAMPGFKKYFANTSWLMAEKIFRMAVALSVGVYVARYLGPERFGVLSYAMSVVVLFSALSSLGLNGILVRELVNFPKKRDEFLGTAFILKLAGSGLVLILLSITLYFMGDDRQSNLMIFIIAAGLVFRSFNVIRFYFEAKVLSKYFVSAQFVSLIAVSIAKLIFIWLGLPLIYFALVVLIESLFLAIGLSVVYFKQNFSILSWQFKLKTATGLLKDSWPLILSVIAVSIYMRIDQVMIKQMLNAAEVGQYAAAVKLSEVWYFIPVLITQSIFPAIINAKRGDGILYQQRMQQLYDFMTFLSLSIAIIITLSSSLIMNTLFGQAYFGSDKVLAIHIWAGVLVFFGTARGKWIIAENLQRRALIVHITGAILNVILNLILIPGYGAVGAALATLISYTSCTIITSIAIKELRTPFIMYMKSFVHCITFKIVRQVVIGKYVI